MFMLGTLLRRPRSLANMLYLGSKCKTIVNLLVSVDLTTKRSCAFEISDNFVVFFPIGYSDEDSGEMGWKLWDNAG